MAVLIDGRLRCHIHVAEMMCSVKLVAELTWAVDMGANQPTDMFSTAVHTKSPDTFRLTVPNVPRNSALVGSLSV